MLGGIRKIVGASRDGPEGRLGDGDEVTYSEIAVADRASPDKPTRDENVEVLYAGRNGDPDA